MFWQHPFHWFLSYQFKVYSWQIWSWSNWTECCHPETFKGIHTLLILLNVFALVLWKGNSVQGLTRSRASDETSRDDHLDMRTLLKTRQLKRTTTKSDRRHVNIALSQGADIGAISRLESDLAATSERHQRHCQHRPEQRRENQRRRRHD